MNSYFVTRDREFPEKRLSQKMQSTVQSVLEHEVN